MEKSLYNNLSIQSVIIDEKTFCSYKFSLGKLYGFKRPKYYSTQTTLMTFYSVDKLFDKTHPFAITHFIDKKDIMVYVGYINKNNMKNNNTIYKESYINTIPCFLYKNMFIIPEPYVSNNPLTFFVELY